MGFQVTQDVKAHLGALTPKIFNFVSLIPFAASTSQRKAGVGVMSVSLVWNIPLPWKKG